MTSWLLASVHLLAVAAAFASIFVRAALLRRVANATALLRPIFLADALWGVTALVLLGTGLWRLFGMTDKVAAYYFGNGAYWTKMTLLVLILVLELRPMLTLLRWRFALRRGETPDLSVARGLGTISLIQGHLLMGMILAAAAMARGLFN
jgi:putative membrane protein